MTGVRERFERHRRAAMGAAGGRRGDLGGVADGHRVVAQVNLAAIERNCALLRSKLRAGTELCAVVKAAGYGHGASQSARAALAGGASRVAVATAEEAAQLRRARITAPILVLGALSWRELEIALAAEAEVVAWSEEFVRRLRGLGGGRVHVKLDSGMGRLGSGSIEEADGVVESAARAPEVELAGVMTHFATADEDDDAFLREQLEAFRAWAGAVRERHPAVKAHAANSAATLREPESHFDMVRCGIAVYGLDPFGEDGAARDLEPALALRSYIAMIKSRAAGQGAGYGRRFIAREPTDLAVLPIGYGDGWRRALGNGKSEALIGGRRYPVVGTVSMDNITVDLGGDASARPGDPVTLIGDDGAERITAEEVARRLGTINYEVTTALTARVTRVYHRDGLPVHH